MGLSSLKIFEENDFEIKSFSLKSFLFNLVNLWLRLNKKGKNE